MQSLQYLLFISLHTKKTTNPWYRTWALPGSVSFPVLHSCLFAVIMGTKSHIKINGKALPFSALTNVSRFRSSLSSLNYPQNQSSLDQTSVPLSNPALAYQPPSSNFSSISFVGFSFHLLLESLFLIVVHSTLVFLYVRCYEVWQSWKRHNLCLQRIYMFFLSIWTWLSTKRIKVFWRS